MSLPKKHRLPWNFRPNLRLVRILFGAQHGGHQNRDPHIIHVNIVSLCFGGKSNMFHMGKMYLLRSPAPNSGVIHGRLPLLGWFALKISGPN